MEEKGQVGYRTTFHMDQASHTQAKGAVDPEGTAEGQAKLAVGAAVGTIGRQDQTVPSRPHQKNGGIPKGAGPLMRASPARRRALTRPTAALRRLLGRVLQLFSREKS